jgi:hypothetical protein
MNENNNFASQFIDLWQENFEKMLSTETNMSQVQQILETMKGFYAAQQSTEQQAAAANSNAHSDGDVAELVRSLSLRVAELEGRLADYERGSS